MTSSKNQSNITFYPECHPMDNLQQVHPVSNKIPYLNTLYISSEFMLANKISTICVNQAH